MKSRRISKLITIAIEDLQFFNCKNNLKLALGPCANSTALCSLNMFVKQTLHEAQHSAAMRSIALIHF